MTPEEKSKRIIEALGTKKGRERLARKMREPLSYGFKVPYADYEFLCECDRIVKPTGFGVCPECGFDLMLSEPVPSLVIVVIEEWE